MVNKVHHQAVKVGDLEIFYREAGPAQAPTLLLLHGFPTSSHMFRDLLPLLADRFHLVAPDYPGFGYSSAPSASAFDYTFDRLADVIEGFVEALRLEAYALYAQDFGGPVGFRLATRRPERVRALIIQNANAYVEGMTHEVRDWLLGLSRRKDAATQAEAAAIFELPYTKKQFLEGVTDASLVSPDAWEHAQWGMDRPGNKEIQYLLHANYASNFDRYEEWHEYFRRHQPPTLVVWGGGDFVFGIPGAKAYARDLATIETHVLADAGHFALESHSAEIAAYMRGFLDAHLN